jgi:hypothetical protein
LPSSMIACIPPGDPRCQRAAAFVDLLLAADSAAAILEKLRSNEPFEELLIDALEASVRGNCSHRSLGLASVVSQGIAADDATISELRLIERAILGLAPIDLRALEFIAGGLPRRVPKPSDPSMQIRGGTTTDMLRDAVGGRLGSHEAIAARLLSLGLVEDCGIGTFGYSPAWSMTDFGRDVLGYLDN